jgi:hypothetical protein
MLLRQDLDPMIRRAEMRLSSSATLLALFFSQTLFLWMFYAAEGLEQMAKAGSVAASPSLLSGPSIDVVEVAYRYAADWRHGMAGGSPLYMPGFFAAAITTWLLACQRPLRQLCLQWFGLLPFSIILAMALSSAGLQLVIAGFTAQTGFQIVGGHRSFSSVGVFQGIYTLVAWCTFIVSSHQALRRRSLWPLLFPLVLGLILALIRPMTVGDFTSLWFKRIQEADFVAIVSLLLIPIIATNLYLIMRETEAQWPSPDREEV